MTTACPDCGSELQLAERTVQVRRGTCGSCGHELMVFASEARVASGESPSDDATSHDAGEGGPVATTTAAFSIPCPSCAGTLTFAVGDNGGLTATCADCDSTFAYVLETERDVGRRAAPERRERRSFGRDRFEPAGPAAGPPARPCRKCGEPLRFSTNPDGTVTGECAACGNRFTLPPRREGGRWNDRPSGGFRPRGAGGPRGRGSWPSRNRRGGSYPPRSRPPSDGDRRERRRRPRRDDDEE